MNLITRIFLANFVCQNFIAMKKLITLFAVAGVIASSCNKPEPTPTPEPDKDPGQTEQPNEPVKIPIKLSAGITSKATDSAFEDGDEIGIYVVNYNDDTAGTLANSGNHLNNTKFTLNGTEWETAKEEYWLDQKTKAETSGNYQHIVSITTDCDNDALVIVVEPDGPACHKGTTSCFETPVFQSEQRHEFSYEGLMDLIKGRKTDKKEGSYTTYLFEKGIDKILKKVGEECTEVIIAAKDNDKAETIYEIADLAYHVMVLMIEQGISLEDIHKELASRHVIDHKVKQEKMTK